MIASRILLPIALIQNICQSTWFIRLKHFLRDCNLTSTAAVATPYADSEQVPIETINSISKNFDMPIKYQISIYA